MALRWRNDGKGALLCAAKHTAEPGDLYIDDDAHYRIAVIEKVIIPDVNEEQNGIWHMVKFTPKRKYESVTVSNAVYCSSSMYYYVDVVLHTSNGKSRKVNYSISVMDGIGRNGYLNLPRYVAEMIDVVVLDLYNNNKLTIYEYTRDGDKRYTELRYHNPTWFHYLVNRRTTQNIGFTHQNVSL